ncbi:hypothetical protein ACH4E8_14140 [Streptomyces sp. NPDC017979]|uniref:hypothetical protein n=1 Tax=Streptomyces sp. NPDC017979 TaxID=3365024 RepID=UPI003795F55D
MALTRQTVVRNLWASPALFITAAFIAFILVRSDKAISIGWLLYWAGWLPPLAALVTCAASKEKPGTGGIFALCVLLIFGGVFWLNHG